MHKIPKIKESKIEDYFKKLCKKYGYEQRKVKWIGHRAAPDRVIFTTGGIYVELKRPGEHARSEQVLEHGRMRKAGMKVEVVASMEELDELFDKINSNNV